MKNYLLLLFLFLLGTEMLSAPFFYGGRIVDNAGAPLSANADLTFRLWINGASTSCIHNNSSVVLNNGIFNIPVDFDSPSLTCGAGSQSFADVLRNAVASSQTIEIEITHNNAVPSAVVYPRQLVGASPLAVYAINAESTISNNSIVGSMLNGVSTCGASEALTLDGAGVFQCISISSGSVSSVTSGNNAITIGGTAVNPTISLETSSMTCPAGSSIRQLNSDGSVLCEVDDGSVNSLNGQAEATQDFAISNGGLSPSWSSSTVAGPIGRHTLNIPSASGAGVTAGLISKNDYDDFKQPADLFDGSSTMTSGRYCIFDGTRIVCNTVGGGGGAPTGPAGGSLSGTYPNPTIAANAINASELANNAVDTTAILDDAIVAEKLQGSLTSTGCGAGQVLSIDGSGNFVCVADSGFGGGSSPTGAAGGELSGTYPNPNIADNSIDSANIIADSLTAADLAANSVGASELANNAVDTAAVAAQAITDLKLDGITANCSVGQVYKADGSGGFSCAADNSGGAPSGAAGGDLSGTYPNPSIAANAIGSSELADNAVTASKLIGSVTTCLVSEVLSIDALGNFICVTDSTGGAPSGSAGGELAGTYPNPTIADNSIDSANVIADSLTAADLAANSVEASELANNAVDTAAILDDAIVAEKLQGSLTSTGCGAGQVLSIDGSGNFVCVADSGFGGGSSPTGAAGGELSGTYPNPNIADNSIDSANVIADSLTAADLAANSVTASELANNAVDTAAVAAQAITDLKLDGITANCSVGQVYKADGSGGFSCAADNSGGAPSGAAGGELSGTYPNPNIADNSIDSANVITDSLTAADLAANSVTASELANNAVDTAAVAAQAITDLKLDGITANCSVGQVYKADGSGGFSCAADNSGGAPSGAAGGDLSGTYPNPSIAANAIGSSELANSAVTAEKLQGSLTATGCGAGQVLSIDGSGNFVCVADSGFGGGSSPTGAAGGELSGTYPNPNIADNSIDSANIIADSLTAADLAANSVGASELANNAVDTAAVAAQAITDLKLDGITANCSVGQVYKADGSGGFSCAADNSGGAPSGAAGGDLSGTYPNPSIAANAIGSSELADNAVTASKLIGSVTTCLVSEVLSIDALGNFICVTDSTGGAPSGSAGGELAGTYPNPTIADNSIDSANVIADSLTAADLAANSVTASELANNAVDTAAVAAQAITDLKLDGITANCSVGQVYKADGSGGFSCAADNSGGAPSGAAGGDLSGTYPNPSIAANAIGSSELANSAVTAEKLQGSLTATGCGAGQVLSIDGSGNFVCVADSGFGGGSSPTGAAGGELSGTYPNPNIADNSIDSANIIADSLTAADLAANSVTASELANNAVDTAAVAAQAITDLKLDGITANCSVGEVYKADGSGGFSCAADNAGGAPSGAAGGELSGTYPNPNIADNSIDSANIIADSLTAADLAANSVDSSELAAQSVTNTKINGIVSNCSANQVLKANGTGGFSCASDNAGGAPSGAAGGDLSGTYPNPSIAANAIGNSELADNAVTASKLIGSVTTCLVSEVLSIDALGNFICVTDSTGGAPSGSAGGELAGTYPNPTIADNSIDSANVIADSLTAADLAANSVAASELANNAVDTAAVAAQAITDLKLDGITANCSVGQVYKADGSGGFSCASDNAGGAPSGAAGGDLVGTYPNPTLASNSVSAAEIIAGAVGTSELATNAVTNINMADNAIGSAEVIADSLTAADLAANSVAASELANNAVDTAAVAAQAITDLKLDGITANCSVGEVYKADGSGGFSCASDNTGGAPSGAAGGDLVGTYPNPTLATNSVAAAEIAAGAVGSSELATNAVTNIDMADNAIGSAEVIADSLTAADLAANSVDSSELAAQSVTNTKINGIVSNCSANQVLKANGTGGFSCASDNAGGAPSGAAGGDLVGTYPNPTLASNSVAAAEIIAGAVGTSELATNAVTNINMADNAIGSAEVIADSLTAADLAANSVTASELANNAVDTAAVAAQAITDLKLDGITANCSVGEVYKADGSGGFSCASDNAGGAPSGAAGGDLVGTYPNPTLASNSVSAAEIIAGAVGTSELATNAVTNINMADNAIGSAEVIADSLTAADLAANSVAASELANNAVDTAAVAAQAITDLKLDGITANCSVGEVYKADGSGGFSCASDNTGGAPSGAAGGDLVGTYPNPTLATNSVAAAEIAAGAVGSSELATNAVTNIDMADNAIGSAEVIADSLTAADLAANSVDSSELAAQSVTNTKINGIVSNCSANQVLKANGAGGFSCASDNSGGAPSGAAGGALTGTYPNPAIAVNGVTQVNLATGSVNSSKISDGSIGSIDLASNSVTSAKVSAGAIVNSKLGNQSITDTKISGISSSCSLGQVLKASGTGAFTCGTDNSGGAPSGAAGGDLSGTYPNPTLATNSVAAAEIAAGAVGSSELATNAVTNIDMADNAIGSAEVIADSLTAADLAANSVGASEIAANAVGSSELAAQSVTNTKINGIASNCSANQVLKANGTGGFSCASDNAGGAPSGAAGGDLVGTYPNPTLASNSVAAAEIAAGAVGSSELATNAVTNIDMADNAIGSAEVIADSLTAADLAANSVGASEIAAGAVGQSEIATNGVAAAEIAANAVGISELAAQSVTNTKINGITANCTLGQVLKANGTGGFSCAADSTGGDNLGNHSATTTLQLNNNVVSEVNELRFNSGSNHSIGSNANGLLFDGGDGTYDFLVYDNEIYSDVLRLGYSGSASIITHDTNESLTINPNGTGSVTVSGNLTATSFIWSSDERLKKDIRTYDNALERVLKLRGVRYTWDTAGMDVYDATDGIDDIGFIAQEVQEIEPTLVREDERGYLSVKYANIAALLVESIKEMYSDTQLIEGNLTKHEALINGVERRVSSLENENIKLQKKVESLEQRLERLEKLLLNER